MIGIIVVGIFPATAAAFTIARKWITGDTDIGIFSNFLLAYRQSFKEANILGYVLLLFGYILYLDFLFITLAPNQYVTLLTIPFLFILILFVLTTIYVYPVYVYYDMKVFQTLKSAFFIMLLNPLSTLTMLLGLLGILYILWNFQGLAIFFSMGVICVALMMPAHRAFLKIHKKQNMHIQ